MRKLASIQRIKDIQPIPKADRIEVATINGWQVVVKKGDFQVGDKCVYFEIDSILPDEEWCKFMEGRKWRVKTIKLRKQISQGLALRLEDVFENYDPDFLQEGEDMTSNLNVKKHDPQALKEAKQHNQTKRVVPHKWLLRWSIGRMIHQKIWPRASGSWPDWFPKTDETRIQNLPNVDRLVSQRQMYSSEKLDGQSVTFFYHRSQKTGLFDRGMYGVCSRNIWYKSCVANNWWNLSNSLNISERLENYCKANKVSLAIQGEIIGPGIQKNRYKRDEHEVHFFNVYDIEEERYLNYTEKLEVLDVLGLSMVPTLYTNQKYQPGFDYLADAEGMSCMGSECEAEGVVYRDMVDDHFSFKAVSNKFLLEGGE